MSDVRLLGKRAPLSLPDSEGETEMSIVLAETKAAADFKRAERATIVSPQFQSRCIRSKKTVAAVWLASIATLCASNSAIAQSPTDILPPGYAYESFESSWLGPGNNPPDVCAGLVRKKYGNRKYAITSVGESQRYRIPELRIDSQYQYRCTVLLAPE